jgi:SAM-dependent methyltransferase
MDLKERAFFAGKRHPWELARVAALSKIVAGLPLPETPRVLDVGCGDGFTALELLKGRAIGALVGVDPALSQEDRHREQRGSTGFDCVPTLEDLPREAFDLVLLLDVLEHVDGDLAMLRKIAETHLRSGGHALITAPAFSELFGPHDRFLGHKRRYDRRGLAALVEDAGLTAVKDGYLFGSLLLVRALETLAQWIAPGSMPEPRGVGAWRRGPLLSSALERVLRLDNGLLLAANERNWRLPGLTIWTLSQKP